MTRKIKALGVKMVLSGEGSDEIFGGYLYFHKAPNKEELHKETVRKVTSKLLLVSSAPWRSSSKLLSVAIATLEFLSLHNIGRSLIQSVLLQGLMTTRLCPVWQQIKALYMFDCLRANKSTSAWGLEARVPFLDQDFMNVAMAIDPAEKMVPI